MGTYCAHLVADLFLLCYERDFMMSLSDDKQADDIDAFNITSRYLDDILSIHNVYFDNIVSHIYLSDLQLIKANTSDTEAAFLDLMGKRELIALLNCLPGVLRWLSGSFSRCQGISAVCDCGIS